MFVTHFLPTIFFKYIYTYINYKITRAGTTENPVTPEVVLIPIAPRRVKLAWQVATEQHSMCIRKLLDEESYNFLGEAKRWMSFPLDRSIVSIKKYLKRLQDFPSCRNELK